MYSWCSYCCDGSIPCFVYSPNNPSIETDPVLCMFEALVLFSYQTHAFFGLAGFVIAIDGIDGVNGYFYFNFLDI